MDELRLESVAASVAAWHNRHPLARRIGLAQVQSVGFVRLPFAKGPRGLTPAFSEDFVPPWRPARVARWVRRHGREGVELGTDVPRREVQVDRARLGRAGGSLVMLTVRTAEVDAGGEPERVLLGPGARPAVLGRRLASGPRLGAALLAGVLAAVGLWQPVGGWLRGDAPGEALVAVAPAASAASAATVAASASASAPAPVVAAAPVAVPAVAPVASAPAVVAAPQPAPKPTPISAAPVVAAAPSAAASSALPPDDGPPDRAPAVAAQRPVDVEPRWGRVELPPKPVILDKPRTPVYGLASTTLRTTGEGERVQGLMARLLAQAAVPGVQVERLQVGEDWRVVGYPFADKAAAERTAALLLKRGLRTEVIDF